MQRCSGSFRCCRIFALVTLSSYSVMPRERDRHDPAALDGRRVRLRRRWLGRELHQRGSDRLRARRLPRMDPDGCRGDVHAGPQRRLPDFLGGSNPDAGVPIAALLVLTFVSTSCSMAPDVLRAAYAFALDLTRTLHSRVQRNQLDHRGSRHRVHVVPLRRGRPEVPVAVHHPARPRDPAVREGSVASTSVGCSPRPRSPCSSPSPSPPPSASSACGPAASPSDAIRGPTRKATPWRTPLPPPPPTHVGGELDVRRPLGGGPSAQGAGVRPGPRTPSPHAEQQPTTCCSTT